MIPDGNYPLEQAAYDWLCTAWERRRRGFPCGGAEVDGICLVQFDADLDSLIEAYVRRRALRPKTIALLRELHADLRRILPLPECEAALYFAEKEKFVATVLRLIDGGYRQAELKQACTDAAQPQKRSEQLWRDSGTAGRGGKAG